MTNLIKCIVPVFALALALGGVPAFADPQECTDSPSVVILPDCTTIEITTCYCHVPSGGADNLDVVISALGSVTAGETACDGSLCATDKDTMSSDVRVDDIRPRNNKNPNATPAKNGKTTTAADCDDCDGRSVNIDVESSTRKNSHFDLLIEESDDTFVCKVGFQSHTQSCPNAHI